MSNIIWVVKHPLILLVRRGLAICQRQRSISGHSLNSSISSSLPASQPGFPVGGAREWERAKPSVCLTPGARRFYWSFSPPPLSTSLSSSSLWSVVIIVEYSVVAGWAEEQELTTSASEAAQTGGVMSKEDDAGSTPAPSAGSTHRGSLWMSMGLVSSDDCRRRRMSKRRESIELASLGECFLNVQSLLVCSWFVFFLFLSRTVGSSSLSLHLQFFNFFIKISSLLLSSGRINMFHCYLFIHLTNVESFFFNSCSGIIGLILFLWSVTYNVRPFLGNLSTCFSLVFEWYLCVCVFVKQRFLNYSLAPNKIFFTPFLFFAIFY